ncbi:MAG: hypothetical protein IAE80_00570 [Anaerolinea sp.]|nr:hypothetical protein [Anaerolinea sp.]
MKDDRSELEDIARYTAGELIDAITMHAASAEDVQHVIDELIAFMRAEWASVDWQDYAGQFGPEAAKRQQENFIKSMLDRRENPPEESPPINWGKRGPPPSFRALLDDEEAEDDD